MEKGCGQNDEERAREIGCDSREKEAAAEKEGGGVENARAAIEKPCAGLWKEAGHALWEEAEEGRREDCA